MSAALPTSPVVGANALVATERTDVALDAIYQIDAVLETFGRIQGAPGFDLMMLAVLPRLLDLTAVIMSALGDEDAKPAAMRMVVDRWSAKAVQL